MANTIKPSGADGLALQVTKPARAAGLVEENSNGKATDLADVRVYAFNQLLLVVDRDVVQTPAVTDLVVTAAQDTDSIYRAMDASIQIAGNGYQLQLPPAADAGFTQGDRAPCHPAPSVLIISTDDGAPARADSARLAADLVSLRRHHLE